MRASLLTSVSQKSFSPIERPFHHLVSLITHFPYLFPPSPHVVPSSVGKEDVESLFWTPNTRGISSPNQPPYHRPASIPPASLSSLDPFFEGSENDWNLLWETAHDLARIAGTRFLELDRSHLAKREEGSEGEKEVYWNCFLMLVRHLFPSFFRSMQELTKYHRSAQSSARLSHPHKNPQRRISWILSHSLSIVLSTPSHRHQLLISIYRLVHLVKTPVVRPLREIAEVH